MGSQDLPVMLNVRGTFKTKTLDEARKLHNETAGSKEGMEAARSLSDLSHTVYVPCKGAGKLMGAKENELLFIDYWSDPKGLQQFFSNHEVQEQGAKLFVEKDPTVWMPATGSFSISVPPISGKRPQYLGLLRARVKSPEAAIMAFGKQQMGGLARARRRGHLAHHLYVKLGPPGEPVEVTGLDVWSSLEGMVEHYSDQTEMQTLGEAFTGAPQASVWEQSTGFNEW